MDTAARERLLRMAFIPWLAGIDPDTDKRKRRVAWWEEIPAKSRSLVERLISQRLLVRDRRSLTGAEQEADVLEVAHEALLRQWSSPVTWLDEDADQLKQAEVVRRAAEEWRKNSRNEAWLVHTGARLESALSLQQRPDYARLIGPEGDEYIRVCQTRERQAREEREAQLQRIAAEQARTARAQKRTALLLMLFAVVLFATGGWIVRQTRAVSRQTSLVLATNAQTASSQRAYDRALRYAVLAARDSWISPAAPEAEAMLAQAANSSRLVAQLRGHTSWVISATFSPDGSHIVRL